MGWRICSAFALSPPFTASRPSFSAFCSFSLVRSSFGATRVAFGYSASCLVSFAAPAAWTGGAAKVNASAAAASIVNRGVCFMTILVSGVLRVRGTQGIVEITLSAIRMTSCIAARKPLSYQ